MKDISFHQAELKKDWALSQGAFRRLLAWLDEGSDSGGEKYLEVRRRLVSYFDRKNCLSPDELADETLNRVARRLEEEGELITDTPAHYCYIVAKFVFLEYLRRSERNEVGLDEVPGPARPAETGDEKEEEERRLDCLDRCLQDMDPESRELIILYYRGEQRAKIDNRREMAARLGITANALSIRACRIRDRLESCVGKCLKR